MSDQSNSQTVDYHGDLPSGKDYVGGQISYLLTGDELEAIAEAFGEYLPRPIWPPDAAGLAFNHGARDLLERERGGSRS